ncbi:VWA domain-containing protein [Corallococcus sp. H22C18031201]|uniref:vWA domain-containing protein n=1 Tax=Citreicoccus inhibens TaxID=2849499 RepID=UPI000E75692A|nr:vWA domain-containing protein [Citreicoccus inhibens]MBU8895748.1 VWA domain-containing protein [Citreicoccus inhibens]RJS20166.1 VWA domain-containing protein [Corallococcus sp. H22C18031201]
MFKPFVLGLGLFALPPVALAGTPVKPPPAVVDQATSAPRVQIALLLDTSGSMDGLIDQARRQMWTVVNTFQKARRGEQLARLEIALYEYGKSDLAAEAGYMRQVLPFTTDLDSVSEKLFALRTNGGDEYCGQVIQKATTQLAWSKSREDLKLIYIAGNEPFNQGPVPFATAIANAKEHGIIVNTVHCGGAEVGARDGWTAAAALAQGQALNIDQNRAVAQATTPQDAELARLSGELNQTYLGYGSGGREGKARQVAQDSNAAPSPSVAASRAVSKASRLYDNSSWDLVDGSKSGAVKLDTLKDEELPSELQGKSVEERKAVVAAKAKEREAIQERIVKLKGEREKYLSEQQAVRPASAGPDTLDTAIIQSVRKQAAGQKLTLE